MITSGWNQHGGANLLEIISRCRRNLAHWKKAHRNHSGKQIESLKRKLESEFLRVPPNTESLATIKNDLQIAYKAEEKF